MASYERMKREATVRQAEALERIANALEAFLAANYITVPKQDMLANGAEENPDG